MSKGPLCAGCAMEAKGGGFVQITTPVQEPRLIVQGSMPSQGDVDDGKAFGGKAGWWLKRVWLGMVGIDESEVVYDYTIRCRPNTFKDLYPKKKDRANAEWQCAGYAKDRSADAPLLLVADESAQSVLGYESVATWHGHIERQGSRVVGLTYPPMSVMKQPNLLPLVVRETQNLMEAARNSTVLDRPDVIKGHIPYRASEECVVDLEWDYDRKTKKSGQLTVVGIAHEAGQSYASHGVAEGLEVVQRHIADGTRIIGHNVISADIPKLGVLPKSFGSEHVIDTMIVAHIVHAHWAELGLYGLEDLVRYYRPTTAWKHDKSDLLYYNGLDTAYNYRLWEDLQIDLTMTDQWHLVSKDQRLARMTYLMRERGMRIDSVGLRKFQIEWTEKRAAIKASLPFNPQSPVQIKRYFAGEKIALAATDIETLERMYKRKSHPMLGALIAFKDEGKGLKAWYSDEAIAKGRIHPKFNVTGTAVARFSSSDPNAQNIPPDYRRFILPESDDHFIASFDGKNIEGRTVAWNADDRDMLADFASGQDIHKLVASRILDKSFGDVTKEERQAGKMTVHATNYLEGEYNLANRLYGNQTDAAKKKARGFQQGYFAAYPRTREWQLELQSQMDRGDIQLRNPFGRVRFIYGGDSHERAKRACHYMGCSTGADLVNQRALDVWDETGLIPLTVVHDELAYSLPRGEHGERLVKQIKEICEAPIAEMNGFVIPFGYKAGENYGEWGEEG